MKSFQFIHLIETFLMSFTKFSILLSKLFMKKLLISWKLFVSLKTTINLSSLRLNNSTQFLDILLLSESAWNSTISENLLLLSFKENPDVLIF